MSALYCTADCGRHVNWMQFGWMSTQIQYFPIYFSGADVVDYAITQWYREIAQMCLIGILCQNSRLQLRISQLRSTALYACEVETRLWVVTFRRFQWLQLWHDCDSTEARLPCDRVTFLRLRIDARRLHSGADNKSGFFSGGGGGSRYIFLSTNSHWKISWHALIISIFLVSNKESIERKVKRSQCPFIQRTCYT